MSEQHIENTTEQTEPSVAKRKPRIRLPQKPSLPGALAVLSQALGAEFNPLSIERLPQVDAAELEAIRRRIFDGVDSAIRGVSPTEFDAEVAMNIFWDWQRPLGQYYQWPDKEPLRRKLKELGDDVVALTPCYAYSVGVRLRSGRTILINREGREVQS
jgi:hypothetical protein